MFSYKSNVKVCMLKWKKGEEPLNKKTKYTVAMIHIDTAQKQQH